ncbi:dTDP-4-dehydrorhamnose reductase [Candidatus Nomurabacteria bacterium]|nr:dTDP-4-dehydrorhamnose reductase [Candidatus Nomurabacteria bacterium]
MKTLILGAKGTLGQALIQAFSDTDLVAWDREELDISDFEKTKQKIRELKPDVIINAVAINAVDDIETKPEVYEAAKKVNGLAPGNLAQIAKDLDIPFVHYSTDYIFDGKTDQPYTEDATPHPLSKYGELKVLAEQEVQKVGGQYYIIRLARLFGKPGISDQSKRSFVDTMIWLATKEGKEELRVVSDQKGSPTYAPDLAQLTRYIVDNKAEPGIYHGCNSGECSLFELAVKTFEIKGINISVHPVDHTAFPRPAAVPAYSPLANTKLPQQRTWENALKEYLS